MFNNDYNNQYLPASYKNSTRSRGNLIQQTGEIISNVRDTTVDTSYAIKNYAKTFRYNSMESVINARVSLKNTVRKSKLSASELRDILGEDIEEFL